MALVITLIMLSVITFMTVTFLVLSQRERGSVTTSTDQLMAKEAADSAMERAKIELLAPMLNLRNDQVYDLIVSTNYIRQEGFIANNTYFTNVNYDYLPNGGAVLGNNALQNIANLFYNPRPPVFVKTNANANSLDFRYYLDLNRNGRYEPSGYLPEIGYDGLPVVVGGVTNYGWHVGDPQWIGVLERPDQPHSANNKFIARYAYLVVPAGMTLDVNYIHNQAKRLGTAVDGFSRNQGVGSYEINLAAFLTDLNTNIWFPLANQYSFNTNLAASSAGASFEDALTLLRYRYSFNGNSLSGNYNNLNLGLLLGDNGSVDEYANGASGTLMTGTSWINDFNDTGLGFPGADNPSHLFTTQEFFDRNKLATVNPVGFVDRLTQAGNTNAYYDRYTYYRMLAQLGTDSEPDRRMNLNYRNVDLSGHVVPGMETNLIQWAPLQFFTNAAERMLRAQFPGTGISITNIPITFNGRLSYPPAVNRLLQLAANMYEATTNTLYPTLFRPYFGRQGTNIYISGFEMVNPVDQSYLTVPVAIEDHPAIAQNTRLNIYGVPWIIGARKGLPNLNEVSAANRFQITRRVLVHRPSTNNFSATQITYKQENLLNVSTEIAVEAWNSYHTNFTEPVEILVTGDVRYALTNSEGIPTVSGLPTVRTFNLAGLATTNTWPGYGPPNSAPNAQPRPDSFLIPLRTNFTIVPPSAYERATRTFHSTNSTYFEDIPPNQLQLRWGLAITNRLRVVIRNSITKQIFDYVQFDGPVSYRDLSGEIRTTGEGINGLWNTDMVRRGASIITAGMNNQIDVSLGTKASTDSDWKTLGLGTTLGSKDAEIATFRAFMYGQRQTIGIIAENPPGLDIQVPFTPSRDIGTNITWQANDPLVHYLADDLVYAEGAFKNVITPPGMVTNLLSNIRNLNSRYKPWGGKPGKVDPGSPPDTVAYNPALKDPLVKMSDNWDFPTNKLPNLGWLGRVHRGTPWQTVYLKSADIIAPNQFPGGLADWMNWTGNGNSTIASNTAPKTDRLIFDLFTTAPNANASRGRLSVNQNNLAAWSAVLSGVVVQTNALTGEWTVIEPAAISPAVAQIVGGINATRANGSVFPNQRFAHLGDVLATPQLTELSPYLLPAINVKKFDDAEDRGVNDEVMERIPQQTLSLLSFSHSPRFVIYSYGQTLRPLQRYMGNDNGGRYFQMVTNYQISAETATRAVVRVDGSFAPGARPVVEQFNVLPPD